MKRKNKRSILCAMLLMSAFAVWGCGEKKVEYGVDVINGDSVAEYSGSAVTTESSGDIAAGDDDGAVAGKTDSVGGLVYDLSIPENAHMDLSVDGTELNSISIEADDIKVPEKDKMYTKDYYMDNISSDERKQMLESLFDEDEGIFNYPYDDKDNVTDEQVDAIFADKGAAVDYNSDSFIGNIDGKAYNVLFTNPEWSTDVGFYVNAVDDAAEITDELRDKGVTHVGYTSAEYLIADDDSGGDGDEPTVDAEMPNKCELTVEQVTEQARDYAAKIGLEDVVVTDVNELYMEYMDEYGAPVAYEKDGYSVSMSASVNAVDLYQPQAFGVDTISHNSTQVEEDYSGSNYYYAEISGCSMSVSSAGLLSISCEWPMRSAGDLKDAGNLLTWDEAVESLESAIPEHFKGYIGYSDVIFNDVRLTYFRTYVEPGRYQVIPVYAFAQIDDEYDDTYPIQLIMLDARDGSEVDIRQDGSRMGAKN